MDAIPEGYLAWHLPGGHAPLGYVSTCVADVLNTARLMRHAEGGLVLDGDKALTSQMELLRAELCRAGLIEAPRGELMPVSFAPGAAVLATIDRSAMRMLGLWAVKVHVNGLVRRDGFPDVWLSRRSLSARAAPGTLDTFVAGGQSCGMSIEQTMVRESAEEVGVSPELALTAQMVARIDLIYPGADGLHREELAIFDLHLPDAFQPVHHDGEIDQSVRMDWSEFEAKVELGADFKHNSLIACRNLIERCDDVMQAAARAPQSR